MSGHAPALLHDTLSREAERRPDATAVVERDRSITYAALRDRANRLAHLLRARGVGPGSCVVILHDKSIDAVVSIHAVLRAGGAYVPVDPQAPPARLRLIVTDAESTVILSSTSKQDLIAEHLISGTSVSTVILTDSEPTAATPGVEWAGPRRVEEQPVVDPPDVTVTPDDLAYIIYTSGSTGVPKGVMLTHENGMAFVRWAAAEFDVTSSDRVLSHAPLHFDLSIFDLFASSLAGATVVLVPPAVSVLPSAILRLLQNERISIWYSVPSVLILFLERLERDVELPTLRTLLFAGEVFPTPQLIRLMRALSASVRFANLYGPTETNVCTWYDVRAVPEDPARTIPIGRAISGVEVFAVTDTGEIAPRGEPGELWVRGPTVMAGYRNDPERTRATLVPVPGDEHGAPAYRTGDVCALDTEGDWRYIGRRDLQVKHLGYRIDLGDIESALSAHAGVVECAAVHSARDGGTSSTIAVFVKVREPTPELDLREFCAERLPRYMVPSRFVFCNELPLTSTGKLDRKALADRVQLELGAP